MPYRSAACDLPKLRNFLEALLVESESTRESSTIQIDHDHCLISIILAGPMTNVGLLTLFERLRLMKEFADRYSVLLDATGIAETHLTEIGVFNLVQEARNDQNRMAIVVRTGIAFGMARMYEMRTNCSSDRVAVFSDLQQAVQELATFVCLSPDERDVASAKGQMLSGFGAD